jgi:hypothetical protein
MSNVEVNTEGALRGYKKSRKKKTLSAVEGSKCE